MVAVDEHFTAWSPTDQVILLRADLTPEQRICSTARMLAHRALGHWGGTADEVDEARRLAASWLMPAADLEAARLTYPTDAEVAAELGVTVQALRVRLGVSEWGPADAVRCLVDKHALRRVPCPDCRDVWDLPSTGTIN